IASLAGCGARPATTPSQPATAPATVAPTAAAAATSPATPAPSFVAGPTLRTLAAAPETASILTVGKELGRNAAYSTNSATYTSDGLAISAVLLRPVSKGPHAGVVLVHGFVDAATYRSGSELTREQDALARAGYVVLYTDLRGLGGSDAAPAGPPD